MKALELADELKAQLEHTLAECRDAYPVPEVGSELEALWGQAMGNPVSVGAYVKACASSQQKEIDELRAECDALKEENERLLAANLDCIMHYEDARAELERIKSLEPIKTELLCVCGCDWQWENRSWELVSGPYPKPAQQPLAEKQIDEVMRKALGYGLSPTRDDLEFARAIEQAHGIGVKND